MLLNELFEVSQDLVSRYKTAAFKDADKAIAAKAAGQMGRDEYERKMKKRGLGTAAAQRRLTPHGTQLDLTPYGDAIQKDYDRYRTDEQGVAEGSELKQAKRKYNQAAKDANADQVGAGKKIDTMKKSLRQKDVAKQGVAEGRTK